MQTYTKQTRFEYSLETLFQWHEKPEAFSLLSPPWSSIRIRNTEGPGGIIPGTIYDLQIGLLKIPWKAKHTEYQKNALFTDEQIQGPFQTFIHKHEFESLETSAAILRDAISYQTPASIPIPLIQHELNRVFVYRHKKTQICLDRLESFKGPTGKILITGGTGLIGSQLRLALTQLGHEVYTLTRYPTQEREIHWNWEKKEIGVLPQPLKCVIHLAGENIASDIWDEKLKQKISRSRVEGTRFLVESLRMQNAVPRAFLSASAIGIYGDRGEEELEESSSPGTSFLANLGVSWEQETQKLMDLETRVCNLRFGIVLDPRGGALKKMFWPFVMGAGGRLGHGRQYMSFIGLEDVVNSILFLMTQPGAKGAFNLVSPTPLSNADFSRILAKVLNRPAFFHLPEKLLTLLPNKMAEELFLASQRVLPGRLINAGYQFIHKDLESILRFCLGREL